jgi:hypothetical protein
MTQVTFNDTPVEVIARVFNMVAIEVTDMGPFGSIAKQIIWVRPEWLKNLPPVSEYAESIDPVAFEKIIYDGTAE